MNIILMGMKHCGKSTAGARLATELGLPFFDLDDLILARHEPAGGGGKTIENYFRKAGAEEFYRMEADSYDAFCGSASSPRFVLAAGGRTPFNPLLERVLEQCGVLIYINTPFAIILKRIREKGKSTLWSGADPEPALREIYDERHPGYLRRAQVVVDGNGSEAVVVKRIKDGLEEYQRGGK